jgi:hypothetical protein
VYLTRVAAEQQPVHAITAHHRSPRVNIARG